ncbi:MAG: flippase-like domain-containing protein [Planctomycetales bacterium]|nr:flippase-like domain-containing protein [Planctomycetales bacterium]
MSRSHLLKTFTTIAKFGVSIGIIAFLVHSANRDNVLDELRTRPKDWFQLALAAVFTLLAVLMSFVRWHSLIRAIDVPIRLPQTLRLGFLGFFCNYISLGSVGGDLFKAVFLARQYQGQRTKAVASVVVDRLIGLYGLFLVAAIAVLAMGTWQSEVREVKIVSTAALVCALTASAGMTVLFFTGFTVGKGAEAVEHLPLVGPILGQIDHAVRRYREQRRVIVLATVMSMATHTLMTCGFYFASGGFKLARPSFAEHFVVVPLTSLAGAIPLPMAGLGAMEYAFDRLSHYVSASVDVPLNTGIVAALAIRAIMIGIAMIGVFYYFASRREVQAAMHEAELEADATSTEPQEPCEAN